MKGRQNRDQTVIFFVYIAVSVVHLEHLCAVCVVCVVCVAFPLKSQISYIAAKRVCT